MACVASFSQSSDTRRPVKDDTVSPRDDSSDSTLDPPTVSVNRFSTLRFDRTTKPLAMNKRKVSTEESSEDSPSSLDGADYTDQGWTKTGGSDWGRFSWAFGLAPSTSGVVGRRRRRRRGAKSSQGGADEEDPMKELLEIVLWNGEREIDFTKELEDDYDSDDDDLECIKRAMAREQTIRPRLAPLGVNSGVASGGKQNGEGAAGGDVKPARVSSGHLSVSNLRFDSLLKIGSTSESTKKSSFLRFEQRTNTMDRAFKGVLEDTYISESSKASSMAASEGLSKTASASTLVEGGGDEDSENFWDDVEF